MNLRKAAEMALESWDFFFSQAHPEVVGLMYGSDWAKIAKERTEALRQALAQPEQEPVGYVTIENISSWAQVPSIKWFKKPTEGPLYTAPVDAVNMSQERVYETAKREHEPVAWVYNGILHEFDPSEFATSEVTPLYIAPPKRKWVGLTDEEVESWRGNYDFFDSALVREVEAKLKEKNT